MNKDYPLTPEEFKSIYSKVPRLCVDIVLKSPKGVYLTLRDIEPCKGQWHIPGGTVFFDETLEQAVRRVAERELGIVIEKAKQVAVIDFSNHVEHSFDHPVSIVYEVEKYSGDFMFNKETAHGEWFNKLPDNMHDVQDKFLLENGYVS